MTDWFQKSSTATDRNYVCMNGHAIPAGTEMDEIPDFRPKGLPLPERKRERVFCADCGIHYLPEQLQDTAAGPQGLKVDPQRVPSPDAFKQEHPDPWMDSEPGTTTFPSHWGSVWHEADYQGWSNWDTWNTALMMDNEQDSYNKVRKLVEKGGGPEHLRDYALKHVIAPHNKQQIADAQDWNSVPEDERVDHHYEDFKEKHPDSMDLLHGLVGGPDVGDTDPQLIDHELVNWDEIHKHIKNEQDENANYDREGERLKGMGLSPDWMTPGHDDAIQHMREAMYRHHGALPREELEAELGPGYPNKDPRWVHNRNVNIPFDELTQRPNFDVTNHISLDTRNALHSDASDRQIQKIWEQKAQEHPDMDPTTLQDLAENTWYRHTPLSERDKHYKYDHNDPNVQAILSQDPQWQETVQNGHNQRLTDYTWDTINALHQGRAHPNQQAAMQTALAGQGHQPEAIAEMTKQRRQYNPATNRWIPLEPQPKPQPDPSLDQPGDLTLPATWTASTWHEALDPLAVGGAALGGATLLKDLYKRYGGGCQKSWCLRPGNKTMGAAMREGGVPLKYVPPEFHKTQVCDKHYPQLVQDSRETWGQQSPNLSDDPYVQRIQETFGDRRAAEHSPQDPDWSLVPPCPHCGKNELDFRDRSSLGPLYPEGAWQCNSCFNVFPSGELPMEPPKQEAVQPQTNPAHPDPWMDNEPGSLTFPKGWTSSWLPVPVADWTSADVALPAPAQLTPAVRTRRGNLGIHQPNTQSRNQRQQQNRPKQIQRNAKNLRRVNASNNVKVHRTASNGIQIFTAYDGNQPVGYTQATVSGNDVRILYAFVDPEHRGKGLGLEMVNAIVSAYPNGKLSTTIETPEGQALLESFKRRHAAGIEVRYGVVPGGARTVHQVREDSTGRLIPYCSPRSRYTATEIHPEDVEEAKGMGYAMCRRCF